MGTYEDKRAELRATAEGGMAGRTAYQQGRERLVSDQRAAIDAALAGPVRFESGTADRLRSIIQPVGDAAAARIDFAGDRHGSSMGELDTYLSRALSQQGGARALNYSTTLNDARTATDRNIEMASIQRRQQQEREAAAAAQASAAEDRYRTEGAQKNAAEGLGEFIHNEQMAELGSKQRQATIDELNAIAREAFSSLPDKRQVSLMMELRENADNPEAIAAMIERYSPAHAPKAQNTIARSLMAFQNIARTGAGQAPMQYEAPPTGRPSELRAIDAALERYVGGEASRGQDFRQLETERYQANRDAYTELFGDPLLAAGIFPADPGFSTIDDGSATREYVAEGMRGSELDAALKADNESFAAGIAAGAGLSVKIVDKTLDSLPVDATEVYDLLQDSSIAPLISNAVASAVAEARSSPDQDLVGKKVNKQEIAADAAAKAVQRDLAGADPQYVQALALIAAEQARVYAKVN